MGILFDIIGMIGVGAMLIAYFLLQKGTFSPQHMAYLLLNLAGAVLIIISLFHAWNLPAFVIEAAWALISIYGIIKAVRTQP